MWYAVRDIAFDDPMDDVTDNRLRATIERAAGSVPPPSFGGSRRFEEIEPGREALITFMTRVLFIEIRAFHAFAWAAGLLGDGDLVAGDGTAADLVGHIRQDETPHVDYLRTSLSEMRERSFAGASGRKLAGAEVIDTVWDACLTESLGLGDARNRAIADALIDGELGRRPDGRELREEFDRIG